MDGALPSPAAAMESHVLSMFPRCPFGSLKGRWRKLRDSRALRAAREHTSITTAAAISCKSITLLHHWHWRQNPSWDPWQVWGGHAHQPGSSPGPNTAHLLATSCLPWLQAEPGGALPLQEEGCLFREGQCCGVFHCCWFASDLVCVIRLQTPHPEHPAASSAR